MKQSTEPTSIDSPENFGSLATGLSGNYQLAVGSVIKEAWGRVGGNKGLVWLALLIYVVVLGGLSVVLELLLSSPVEPVAGLSAEASALALMQQLVTILVVAPLWVGITFIGISIASDRRARVGSIFSWYGKTFKLFITYLLMMIMILLGFVLLVLPGLYLAIAYQLALPLVADKGLGPWQALETSRKAITHKWFTFFGLWLVVAIAMMASMMLIGLPLIWLLPAFVIGTGIVYRNTFGVEPASLDRISV